MRWLNAGAFARLCGINKGALLFYDREGLLKPMEVSENGYRRYAVEQFYTFELISMLKMAGCSLKEIKKHLNFMDGKKFLDFLEDRQKATDIELRNLMRRRDMLGDMIACQRESLTTDWDSPSFIVMQEEKLELWPTDARVSDSNTDEVMRFKEYQDYLYSVDDMPRAPFGAVLDFNAATHERWLEIFYFHKFRNNAFHNDVFIKRPGNYAVIAHKGTLESQIATIRIMLDFIEINGASIIGKQIYAYDLLSYIRQNNQDCVAFKLCIEVER